MVCFFKTSLNFSNQIEIFKPVYFFWSSSIHKKGKISLYIPLSYSFLFSPILAEFLLSYSTPQLLYPFPQIPIKHTILIISWFYFFFLFILNSPGFEPPTSGTAYHCHYHLTMTAMGARSLILVLIVSSSPQAPLI